MARRIALITGTLAEPSLREVAAALAAAGLVQPEIFVLPIQVAALMTADWVGRKLQLPGGGAGGAAGGAGFEKVLVPGYCRGDLAELSRQWGVPVEAGPKDLLDLPELFGKKRAKPAGYGPHAIEIIAEINHTHRLSLAALLAQAEALAAAGADVIDIGCAAQVDRPAWRGVSDAVRELAQRGLRVSVDSLHGEEIALACQAGAELVLSVNASNRDAAGDWGAEVVAIPDDPRTMAGLDETVALLEKRGVRYRIDPILEPIGCGFAASLGRYLEIRKRYPQAAVLMGIGNLTELSEADSAGMNLLLLGICQEIGVGSVLTTQVANWAKTCVRELDVARRLVHFAVERGLPPKNIDPALVMLRDPRLRGPSTAALQQLQQGLTDRNFRLFAAEGELHALNKDVHARGADPFVLFDELQVSDASHAFYLGYELCKAAIAVTLGKNYTQDEALRWGVVEQQEVSHFERRKRGKRDAAEQSASGSAGGTEGAGDAVEGARP